MNIPTNPYQIDKQKIAASFSKAALTYDKAAVLQREVGQRLLERLSYVIIEPERVLDLGCGTGHFLSHLSDTYPKSQLLALDMAFGMVETAKEKASWFSSDRFFCADCDALPFADDSIELIFANLILQWSPNLQHTFNELHRVLKPGGLIMFTTFGPDTLKELKTSWKATDEHVHVNHFVDMHDIGDVMMHSGFEQPVVDMECFTLTYKNVNSLMRDLKALGSNNMNAGRNAGMTGRARIQQVKDAYEQFRDEEDLLPATYEVIYGHAWATNKQPEVDQNTYELSL